MYLFNVIIEDEEVKREEGRRNKNQTETRIIRRKKTRRGEGIWVELCGAEAEQ